jgi:hypothetical protein
MARVGTVENAEHVRERKIRVPERRHWILAWIQAVVSTGSAIHQGWVTLFSDKPGRISLWETGETSRDTIPRYWWVFWQDPAERRAHDGFFEGVSASLFASLLPRQVHLTLRHCTPDSSRCPVGSVVRGA